jgi:hypothetical protein
VIARTKAVEPRIKAFNSFDEADALAQAAASDARRAAGQALGDRSKAFRSVEGRDRGHRPAAHGLQQDAAEFRFALRCHGHARS